MQLKEHHADDPAMSSEETLQILSPIIQLWVSDHPLMLSTVALQHQDAIEQLSNVPIIRT